MEIDRAAYLRDGYVILRCMTPPELLDTLRDSFEHLVRRQYPDGLASGRPPWQPRVFDFDQFFEPSSAAAAEFCVHDNVMETTRRLLQVETAGLCYLYLMGNPARDYGPWFWHRDHSHYHGPLLGMQQDFVQNGPDHLQWNIALYDDDVFWVVPGSHIRRNTEAEDRQLAAIPHCYAQRDEPAPGSPRHTPLPGSLSVDLKAGDGVAYDTMLLHWGSNYTSRLRRCIHIGTRGLRARRYYHDYCDSDNIAPYLSAPKRREFEQARRLYREEQERLHATLRAIVERDEAGFWEGLAFLHPGIRMCGLIKLGILVRNMREQPDPPMGAEFTQSLWQRFASLEEALKVEGGDYQPSFQLRERIPYRVYEMPEGYDTDDFVAGWN